MVKQTRWWIMGNIECDYDKVVVREVSEWFGGGSPKYVLVYPDPVGGHTEFSFWFGPHERPLEFETRSDADIFLGDLREGRAGVFGDDLRFDPLASEDREELTRLGPGHWEKIGEPILN